MIAKVPLPDGKTIGIQYSSKVYNPHYSSYRDTIGLAAMCIKEVNPTRVVDVGCGSGVIGLGLKKMFPLVDVYCSDIDLAAIKQTKRNAERLKLRVTVLQSDLLPKLRFFPVVVCNLPTYDAVQLAEGNLHGPEVAYKAERHDGLALLKKLMDQVQEGSFLITELQDRHHTDFYSYLAEHQQYSVVATSQMAFALFKRATASL